MVMTSTFLRAISTNSPKSLFKFLLRESQKLPKEAQEFYKHSIKQVSFFFLYTNIIFN